MLIGLSDSTGKRGPYICSHLVRILLALPRDMTLTMKASAILLKVTRTLLSDTAAWRSDERQSHVSTDRAGGKRDGGVDGPIRNKTSNQ